MERITFLPLIAHINEQSDYYNQLYRENELKYGTIDHSRISSWMINSIEPIIKKNHTSNPDQLPQLFKTFYIELLTILGNNLGIEHEDEYKQAWKLCTTNPALVSTSPAQFIKAIDSALESIRGFQPQNVFTWISRMECIIKDCDTVDEFLACGRIFAWLCGMAHLKPRAENEFIRLRSNLKQATINADSRLAFAFESSWPNLDKPSFVGETGGFVGFGGYFTAPPIVSQIGDRILVTDRKNSYLLFADSYGKVLLPNIPVSTDKIIQESSTVDLKSFISMYGKKIIPFDDVSSSVMQKSTLVLTRKSSHYLYVYGWSL
ncbi:hypothetical protein [Williamwhitmania taraxaci]|nr:hypothetical protein [Williamwhitmania taraxaci]